jgi:hypothetical protein
MQPASPEFCLSAAAGIQNLCLIWLLPGIQRPPFEQLNPEMLSFPTRPQPPAESNPEMKSTVRRSMCPKNGYPALYISVVQVLSRIPALSTLLAYEYTHQDPRWDGSLLPSKKDPRYESGHSSLTVLRL